MQSVYCRVVIVFRDLCICGAHGHASIGNSVSKETPLSSVQILISHLCINADAGDVVPHDAADLQVLKGMPRLVHVMCEHARLQPVFAVIHPAPKPHTLSRDRHLIGGSPEFSADPMGMPLCK